MSAVERILQLFEPLKSYFLSSEKCPTILEIFFSINQAELCLYFVHNQASVFQNSIQRIEVNYLTVMEVSEEIDNVIFKYNERITYEFIPPTLNTTLMNLVTHDDRKEMVC